MGQLPMQFWFKKLKDPNRVSILFTENVSSCLKKPYPELFSFSVYKLWSSPKFLIDFISYVILEKWEVAVIKSYPGPVDIDITPSHMVYVISRAK